jgi:Sjoegren syndrome nuclear autoantigen 1
MPVASQDASLHAYSDDLVHALEDLREKREEIHQSVLPDEERKAVTLKKIADVTQALADIGVALEKKLHARDEYDKTIHETEAAYMKILESSQTLLHVLNRERANLVKKKQGAMEPL